MAKLAAPIIAVLAACSAKAPTMPGGGGGGGNPDAGDLGPDACSGGATVPIASLLAHNSSASATYDRAHFGANFATSTWITQAGATLPVDETRSDASLNPVTPAHVSSGDVHSLVPSRPDLRWFAHVVPWFRAGAHIPLGYDSSSPAYVAALVADIQRRGFDGIVVDWYGQASFENTATLAIQRALRGTPLKLIVMLDKGIPNLSASTLASELAYVRQQYLGDATYERDNGRPIVMFFGVTDALGDATMASVKASAGGDALWVPQGAGVLGQAWVDQSFDWAHVYTAGVPAADPYNTAAVRAYYQAVAASPKHAFGAMSAGFDGTLTKSVAWSMGKYTPRGGGEGLVAWARTTDAVIPRNVTRMQWVTWNDWEEGTAIEPGVENDVALGAAVGRGELTWTLQSGAESTIDHFEIYGSHDGTNAVALGAAPASARSFTLPTCSGLVSFAVVAVGRPTIRDHASAWVHPS